MAQTYTKAVWWTPSPGDTLSGVLIETGEVSTKYGMRKTAKVETENTEMISVLISGVVLEDAWRREDPQEGERLSVTFHGIPEGKTWKLYTLEVQRPDVPGWIFAQDQDGPPAEGELIRFDKLPGKDGKQYPTPHRRRRTDTEIALAATHKLKQRLKPSTAPGDFSFYPRARTRTQEQPIVIPNDPFEW